MTNLTSPQIESLYATLYEVESVHNMGALTALCAINGYERGIEDFCYWAYGDSVENIYNDYFGTED